MERLISTPMFANAVISKVSENGVLEQNNGSGKSVGICVSDGSAT